MKNGHITGAGREGWDDVKPNGDDIKPIAFVEGDSGLGGAKPNGDD